jgi:hypothetical protein
MAHTRAAFRKLQKISWIAKEFAQSWLRAKLAAVISFDKHLQPLLLVQQFHWRLRKAIQFQAKAVTPIF